MSLCDFLEDEDFSTLLEAEAERAAAASEARRILEETDTPIAESDARQRAAEDRVQALKTDLLRIAGQRAATRYEAISAELVEVWIDLTSSPFAQGREALRTLELPRSGHDHLGPQAGSRAVQAGADLEARIQQLGEANAKAN